MRFWILLFTLLSLGFSSLHAQKHTISGYINDASSGENLIGASVYDAKSLKGTTSNLYGFFSLSLKAGDTVKLVVSYLGYKRAEENFILNVDKSLRFKLESISELKEVVISGERSERIEQRSQMSSIELTSTEIKSLPRFMGEVDILKAIQLLPGVQAGSEGSTGLYVRGGSPDQNLILLDGVPVYNASHLFGFFSVFNADAINSVNLIKGGFPAHYGGRLSSVLEVNMKEGHEKKYKGKIGVGLISSNFMLEGPLKKEKSSFIISARRTYIDILAQPLILAASDGTGTGGYYFYDINSKFNYRVSAKDRLYLSFYMGKDKFYAKNTDNYNGSESKNNFSLMWGNITSVARWNHQFSPRLFLNTTVNFSRFQFDTGIEQSEKNGSTGKSSSAVAKYLSGIRDWSVKADFDYLPSPNHFIKYGIGAIEHRFKPGAFALKNDFEGNIPIDTTIGPPPVDAEELSAYIEDDFKITEALKVNAGVHASAFNVQGSFYHSIQPRISARYLVGKGWAAKASYAQMTQYIHLLTNVGIGLPTDLWVPSTTMVKPENSWQVAAGVAKTLPWEDVELTIEGYYKDMQGIIEYKDGESFLNTTRSWETKVEAGKGWSYGAELLLQKKVGKTTGWIGYTLSWTQRQFPNINDGRSFPFRYDQRHNISFVFNRELFKNIDFSLTWVYGSGTAVTLPTSEYLSAEDLNSIANQYSGYFNNAIGDIPSRNNFRMRAYHRMDISFNFRKQKKTGVRTWNISVFNLYNRKNPFFISTGTDDYNNRVLKQYSLFPILPSISYIFEFN